MADTSPRNAHHRRRRHGTTRHTTDHLPETSDALLLDTDVAERRCWRCRQRRCGDSTRAPTPTSQWRRSAPRDRILLALEQRAA